MYDQFIAENKAFHTHRNVSRFFKRISIGYSAPVDPNGGRPYLCEQDTEEPIHRIEETMENLIPLPVPDVPSSLAKADLPIGNFSVYDRK
jgi:hypothetical protein